MQGDQTKARRPVSQIHRWGLSLSASNFLLTSPLLSNAPRDGISTARQASLLQHYLLVGVVASVEIQQLITSVCLTHSPAIRQIDTALPQETHDIAEELQIKLERLPNVERAYVHVDYETRYKPEHAFKKDL
ncbi:hypothetical protein VTI74DRAFT_9570 [Chaetomium olivicolor]